MFLVTFKELVIMPETWTFSASFLLLTNFNMTTYLKTFILNPIQSWAFSLGPGPHPLPLPCFHTFLPHFQPPLSSLLAYKHPQISPFFQSKTMKTITYQLWRGKKPTWLWSSSFLPPLSYSQPAVCGSAPVSLLLVHHQGCLGVMVVQSRCTFLLFFYWTWILVWLFTLDFLISDLTASVTVDHSLLLKLFNFPDPLPLASLIHSAFLYLTVNVGDFLPSLHTLQWSFRPSAWLPLSPRCWQPPNPDVLLLRSVSWSPGPKSQLTNSLLDNSEFMLNMPQMQHIMFLSTYASSISPLFGEWYHCPHPVKPVSFQSYWLYILQTSWKSSLSLLLSSVATSLGPQSLVAQPPLSWSVTPFLTVLLSVLQRAAGTIFLK